MGLHSLIFKFRFAQNNKTHEKGIAIQYGNPSTSLSTEYLSLQQLDCASVISLLGSGWSRWCRNLGECNLLAPFYDSLQQQSGKKCCIGST